MNHTYRLLALLVAVVCFALSASAADRLRLLGGKQATGQVAAMSATSVTIELGTAKREIPVNEIESLQFDGEPNQLSQARIAVRAGRYDDASALLDKIDPQSLKRPEIAKDVEFFAALAAARAALAGGGSIAEAGKRMFAFERANRDSLHYFEACQTLGNLLAAVGKHADAQAYFNKLAEAPWPDYKMRAGVLVGDALLRQQKYTEALAKFDEVLKLDAAGDLAAAQKAAATLGKAAALGGAANTDEAVKLVEGVIAKTDSADEDLQARANVVLGNCYQAAGKKKEARLAFLHVHLLFPKNPELHAEALANLASLAADLGKAEQAAEARNLLKEKYPHSIWASK
jgi:tetratricopeptide (TPR) repeat protein